MNHSQVLNNEKQRSVYNKKKGKPIQRDENVTLDCPLKSIIFIEPAANDI